MEFTEKNSMGVTTQVQAIRSHIHLGLEEFVQPESEQGLTNTLATYISLLLDDTPSILTAFGLD